MNSIEIPDGVISIGNLAFYNCSSLTKIVISNSVKSIGNEAFSNCFSLSSIVIPNSVRSIEEGAFAGCSNLPYNLKQELISRFGDELFRSQLP